MKGKIEKANFKLIEAELRSFKDSKAELEALRRDIIEGTQLQGERVQSSTISDTTSQKAMRLITSPEILEISKRINAIEDGLMIIAKDELKLNLLKMKYFEHKYTDIGIMDELNISKSCFYNWRTDIIRIIANKLGWKV